jgi:hypothetical protein
MKLSITGNEVSSGSVALPGFRSLLQFMREMEGQLLLWTPALATLTFSPGWYVAFALEQRGAVRARWRGNWVAGEGAANARYHRAGPEREDRVRSARRAGSCLLTIIAISHCTDRDTLF